MTALAAVAADDISRFVSSVATEAQLGANSAAISAMAKGGFVPDLPKIPHPQPFPKTQGRE